MKKVVYITHKSCEYASTEYKVENIDQAYKKIKEYFINHDEAAFDINIY